MKKRRRSSLRKPSQLPRTVQHSPALKREAPSQALDPMDDGVAKLVPYDETLLDRARTQWQFGDWNSLATIDRDTLQHHPDRAKLALLAGAGRLQTGFADEARQFLNLAKDWGISKKLLSQVLIAGVHSSLGRAAALSTRPDRAQLHFEKAIQIGTPGADVRLLAPALARNQLQQNACPRSAAISNRSDTAEKAMDAQADQLLQRCLASRDLHAATDAVLDDITLQPGLHCLLMLKLAETFAAKKDNLTATHYLRQGRHYFDGASITTQVQFLKLLVRIGRADTAADITMSRALQGQSAVPVDDATAKAIQQSYEQVRALQEKKSEHGHDLLLDWLQHNLSKFAPTDTKRVVIEIGTTREDVPGQGSTAKIADFCATHGLDFITVDMDPHNSHMAQVMFARNDMPFTAVTQKGEDFLRAYTGRMDFVFLDAYDFDHGKHSELRQSRYERFLGSRIDEQACHQMHLDCAESVLKKLATDGIVCIDDTWRDEHHRWTAKGTLAMPYLLDNAYTLIEARNRAALLKPPAVRA